MKHILNNKIQNLLLAGTAATLLSACGGSASSYNGNSYNSATGEEITIGIDNPVCLQGNATQEGKIIDSNTNKAIANVNVEVSGCTVTTDKNGYYKLSNIQSEKRTSINFEKEGYINNSSIITVDEDTSNYLEAKLDKNLFEWSYESEDGSKGRNLEIASHVQYSDNDSAKYTGKVNLYYTYKDTTTDQGRDIFPGTFQGLEENGVIVSFVSYKLMVLKLTNDKGDTLKISEPVTINVFSINGTKDQEIPLWYYNEDKGIWVEKGTAQRNEDGTYVCEITHTGTWSISKPVESAMGMYKGKIVDEDENPMPNVRLKAKGKNWVSEDLTTDENGEFEIAVVPNEAFNLSAYNYEEKFGAEFTATLQGIAAGDTVIEE
jgi:hypothetical protein